MGQNFWNLTNDQLINFYEDFHISGNNGLERIGYDKIIISGIYNNNMSIVSIFQNKTIEVFSFYCTSIK